MMCERSSGLCVKLLILLQRPRRHIHLTCVHLTRGKWRKQILMCLCFSLVCLIERILLCDCNLAKLYDWETLAGWLSVKMCWRSISRIIWWCMNSVGIVTGLFFPILSFPMYYVLNFGQGCFWPHRHLCLPMRLPELLLYPLSGHGP